MSLGNETTAPYLRAIIFASGTCRIETKGAKSTGRSRSYADKAHFSEFIVRAPSCVPQRRDARILPRRNNRSFNSDAGGLSLSPVRNAGPARGGFRHRSRPRLYFASCFSLSLVWRALYYRRGDDLQNEPSVWLTPESRERRRRLSSVRIKLAFYYPWRAKVEGKGEGLSPPPLFPVQRNDQDSARNFALVVFERSRNVVHFSFDDIFLQTLS